MASRFQVYSSSDSDNDDETSSNVQERVSPTHDDEPNPFWFEFTEEEDVEESRVTLSKDAKAENEIFSLYDQYVYAFNKGDFVEALPLFVKFAERSRAYLQKANNRKKVASETEQPDEDIRTLGSILTESVAEATDDQNQRQEDNEQRGKNHLIKLQSERASLRNFLDQLKASVANEAAEEEATSEEVTESILFQRLFDLWQGKKECRFRCSQIEKDAKVKKFQAVIWTTHFVNEIQKIQEESRRALFIPLQNFQKTFDTLNKDIREVLGSQQVSYVENFENIQIAAEASADAVSEPAQFRSGTVVIPGGPTAICSVLLTELRRLLTFTELHDEDYGKILAKENELADLIEFVYTKSQGLRQNQCQLVKMLLTLVGLRSESAHKCLYHNLPEQLNRPLVKESIVKTVDILADKSGDFYLGVLYRAYQMGLQLQYQNGKDLLLKSGIAMETEARTQPYWNDEFAIMFNRVVAVLGLAAFATGKIVESHDTLSRLFPEKTSREATLLRSTLIRIGQDFAETDASSFVDDVRLLTSAQILACKQLLIPRHFHIPASYLELAAGVAAVLVDSVAEARRPYSRSYQSAMTQELSSAQKKMLLAGKPSASSTRDSLIAISVALKRGDCATAVELLEQCEAWSDSPFSQDSDDKTTVTLRLKEESLRMYCYTFACSFSSLSVKHLCTQFGLEACAVKCVINQTLLDKDSPLAAFWDEDEELLIIDRGNVTKLQHLVDNAANKVSDLWSLTSGFQQQRGRGGRGRGRGRGR